MLQALNFCHKKGVAHGSFGPGSVMLSTFRDCQARELIVKLDNFGFAQMQKSSAPGVACPFILPPKPHFACISLSDYLFRSTSDTSAFWIIYQRMTGW